MQKLSIEIATPSPIIVKLLYAIVVKQCLTAPEDSKFLEQHCKEPQIREVLENLFAFNKRLIEFTHPTETIFSIIPIYARPALSYKRWNNTELDRLLSRYINYLLTLGFDLEELAELFPQGMPIRRILSLQDQAILAAKLRGDKVVKESKSLPSELKERILDDNYAINILKQSYINQAANKRNLPNGINKKMRTLVEESLSENAHFRENQVINKREILLHLFYLLPKPKSQWTTALSEYKYSVILLTAAYGPSYILKILINLEELESDLNFLNQDNVSALFLAVQNHNLPAAQTLLDNDGDKRFIHQKNNKGETALHEAASRPNLKLVILLLNNGAETNIQDNSGYSPLHQANSKQVRELLLEKGIDSELVDNEGLTAYEFFLVYRSYLKNHQEFETYYKKMSDGNIFLYEELLNENNALDSLIARLRESRGLIFLKEFARRLPDKLLSYRDPYGHNIVHIINRANTTYPGRQAINHKLLTIISENIPGLYSEKNAQGETGLQSTLMQYQSWNTTNIFSNDYFKTNNYVAQNVSPAETSLLLAALPVSLVSSGIVVLLIGLLLDFIITPIIIGEALIGLATLVFVYAYVPPRFWTSFKAFILNALTHEKKREFRLEAIVIDGAATQKEKEPLLSHHANPAGINFIRPVAKEQKKNELQPTLIALQQFLKETKDSIKLDVEDLSEALILEQFLDFLNPLLANENNKSDDDQANSIVTYFEQELSLKENTRSLSKNFINSFEKHLDKIRAFCPIEAISLTENICNRMS